MPLLVRNAFGRVLDKKRQLFERRKLRLQRLELQPQLDRFQRCPGDLPPAIELLLPLRVAFPDGDRFRRHPIRAAICLRECPCACKKAASRARAEKLRRARRVVRPPTHRSYHVARPA